MDLLTKIAAPAAEEIGRTLQDHIHYYREKRKYLLLQKMQRFLEEAGIAPQQIPLKILLPALEYASVEDDDDLHTMWASLLTSAADPATDEVLPSFPDVLRQLSKQEALFINGLYEIAVDWPKNRGGELCTMELLKLQEIYITSVESKRTDQHTFQIFLDDLLRLRLIAETVPVTYESNPEMTSLGGSRLAYTIRGMYMTDYGTRFIAACQRPNRQTSRVAQ